MAISNGNCFVISPAATNRDLMDEALGRLMMVEAFLKHLAKHEELEHNVEFGNIPAMAWGMAELLGQAKDALGPIFSATGARRPEADMAAR